MDGQPRQLGLLGAVAIVVGSVLGPAMLLRMSHAPSWVWMATGLLVLCGAMTIGAISESGGPYVLLRDAFGPVLGFCCGWTFFFAVSGSIIAWLSITFANAFRLGTGGTRAIAIIFIAIPTFVNYRSLWAGARLQMALALVQVTALGLAMKLEAPEARVFYPEAWLVAFVGWATLTFVAGDMREPRRNLPRAFLIGLTACTAVYVIVGGREGSRLALSLLAAGAANAWILTAPWISFAQARDRLFFRRFAEIHPRYGTPSVAILMQGVWAATLAITGMYNDVLGYAWLAAWFFYGMAALGAMKLRRRASALLAVPFALLSFGFVFAAARIWPQVALTGALLVASGVPAYYIWRRFLR